MKAEFFAFGTPRPKGSHRAFVVKGRAIVTGANANEKSWANTVSALAAAAMDGCEPLEGPIQLCMEFFELRPKKHYRKDGLRSDAPYRPTKKPDLDKLMRSVCDALNGICYRDDAQVCEATIRKRYTSEANPRCGVRVTVQVFEGLP